MNFCATIFLASYGDAIPAIEWEWNKQKGDIGTSEDIQVLTNALASLQQQIASLSGQSAGGYPPVSNPMPAQPLYGQGGMMYGQGGMYGQGPMMNAAMTMVPVAMMPMQTGKGMVEKGLGVLKNMSLSITPISKILKGLGRSDKKSKSKADKSYSYTRVKEKYYPDSNAPKYSSVTKYHKNSGDCIDDLACEVDCYPNCHPVPQPRPLVAPIGRPCPDYIDDVRVTCCGPNCASAPYAHSTDDRFLRAFGSTKEVVEETVNKVSIMRDSAEYHIDELRDTLDNGF